MCKRQWDSFRGNWTVKLVQQSIGWMTPNNLGAGRLRRRALVLLAAGMQLLASHAQAQLLERQAGIVYNNKS
jgi:hypothetical protein